MGLCLISHMLHHGTTRCHHGCTAVVPKHLSTNWGQAVEDVFATLGEKCGTMEHVNPKAGGIQCKGVVFILRLYFLPFKVQKWPFMT